MKALKSIANRLFIIFLALDQLICGVIWLRPDHTISGEVGYAALNNKTWALYAPIVILFNDEGTFVVISDSAPEP